jgi:hypothetical protein
MVAKRWGVEWPRAAPAERRGAQHYVVRVDKIGKFL